MKFSEEMSFPRRLCLAMSEGSGASAISCRGREISYEELTCLVDRFSFFFREMNLAKGSRVAVYLDRSEWILVSLLSILKNGFVYVPIETRHPKERISFLLNDTKADMVILGTENAEDWQLLSGYTCATVSAILEKQAPDTTETCECDNHDPACILYTSGSAGVPKGVVLTYGNLGYFFDHVMENCVDEYPLAMPFLTSVSFDISLFQLLTPILSGGVCRIVDNDEFSDPDRLCEALEYVNALFMVPAVFETLIKHLHSISENVYLGKIKRVFIGGDTIADSLLNRIATVFRNAVVTVLYGPTEGTVFCTQLAYGIGSINMECKGARIGFPVKHAEIYILDASLRLLPVGVVGEICIGGRGVSQGYLNNSGLTNEKFPPHPFGGSGRIYRTGDFGRWTRDGQIEFIGRIDGQVKLRGHRIELSEIENVILGSGQVQQVAVVVATENGENKNLVAFVVPEIGFRKQDVLDYLKARLPGYMIPAVIREIDVIPLTENKKINRKALALDASCRPAPESYLPPTNELEKELCEIWQRVLGNDKIGLGDNFFELGGHSLLAMRVATEIRLRLNIMVSVRSISEFATIEDLAELIEIGRSNRLDGAKMNQTIQI